MTINQIAQHLHLSAASVSRALNGQPGVSAETRARVLAEAARMRFVPHGAARSLATSRTEHIGFALYHLPGPLAADPFYSWIMFGVEQELQEHGYHVIVSTLSEQQVAQPDHWSLIRAGRVDGVILAGPFVPPRFILSLYTQGVPLVLVDNAIAGAPIDAVLGDDRDGAQRIAQHLIDHGHTRIAVVSGPDAWYTNRERCAGYLDALRQAGIEPLAVLHADETTYNSGYMLGQQAISHDPTAIVAVNDAMAIGVIAAAQTSGRHVPDDLAVVGFDDIDIQLGVLPLTTVRLRKQYLGRIAARQLLGRIGDADAPQQRLLVATELVVRRSCGCAPMPERKEDESI